LPVGALSRVFRGKFTAGLKQLFRQHKLQFHGSLQSLAEPRRFRQFLRQLFHHDWVVYAKPPFGGPEHVLNYLARYTHRVAMSNHRLVAFQNDRVSFLWKDYAHGGKQKIMTVSADEFLRRFLIHILPKGLVRIRHFGLFANRRRGADKIVYDAQTTSGGSGGPLFNNEGKVIGINFAIVREFGGSNFAIPVGYGKSLLKP
jgi:Putative transposase